MAHPLGLQSRPLTPCSVCRWVALSHTLWVLGFTSTPGLREGGVPGPLHYSPPQGLENQDLLGSKGGKPEAGGLISWKKGLGQVSQSSRKFSLTTQSTHSSSRPGVLHLEWAPASPGGPVHPQPAEPTPTPSS